MTKQDYAAFLDKHAETRRVLDDELHDRYRQLKTEVQETLGIRPKFFKTFVDLNYYDGGYPSENSPPRDEELMDVVASALILYQAIGSERLVKLLHERGVDVSVRKGYELCDPDQKLRRRLDIAEALQGQICELADTIKISGALEAKEKHGIEKPNFIRAVKLASRKKRAESKDITHELVRALNLGENVSTSLDPLTQGLRLLPKPED